MHAWQPLDRASVTFKLNIDNVYKLKLRISPTLASKTYFQSIKAIYQSLDGIDLTGDRINVIRSTQIVDNQDLIVKLNSDFLQHNKKEKAKEFLKNKIAN